MSVILCESVADPNKNDSLWTVDEGDEGVINLIPIPLLLLCNKKILQRLLLLPLSQNKSQISGLVAHKIKFGQFLVVQSKDKVGPIFSSSWICVSINIKLHSLVARPQKKEKRRDNVF